MSDARKPTPARQNRLRKLIGAIGLRLAFCGVLLLVALLGFPDLRSWLLGGWFETNGPVASFRPTSEPAGPGWPHLRGPGYDSKSKEIGLAEAWPAKGPPVLWFREVGRGYSGFAAVGGRVYAQVQTLYAQSVVCLDGDTGTTLWEHQYDWPYEAAGMYPGPRSTPTWHGGRIYFAGPRGTVGCLDAQSGRPIWSLNVIEKFGGRGHDFGYCCSPLVEDGKVILPVGGKGASMVALDARSGSTVWASGDEPASYCPAVPVTLAGRRLVVGLLQNALTLTDLKTGRLLARQPLSSGYDEHAAMPLYDEPLLMLAFPFRTGYDLHRLVPQATEPAGDASQIEITLVRQSPDLSNDVASSVLVNGFVYGFDLRDIQAKSHRPSKGSFKCLDFRTGDVRWTSDAPGHASGIAADGKLFLLNDRGEALLVRATPERYEELGRMRLFGDEICWTSPSLDGGRLYLRSPTRAACLYVGAPERRPSRTAAPVPPKDFPTRKRLDWTRLVAGEREYAFDPPSLDELRRWYVACLVVVLGPAAILGAMVCLLARITPYDHGRRFGHVAFWAAALVLGAVATPLGNRLSREFLFTWPVVLFAIHQLLLLATIWSSRPEAGRRGRFLGAAALLLFLVTCGLYFHACRQAGLAVLWVFLIGFVPSWMVAVPAAYAILRSRRLLLSFAWLLGSFSAYYWTSAAFSLWKGR